MLMRFRRRQIFLVFAFLIITLLYYYHVSLSKDWDEIVPVLDQLREESAATHDDRQENTPFEELVSTTPRPILQYPSSVPTGKEPQSATSNNAVEPNAVPPVVDPKKIVDSPELREIEAPGRKPAAGTISDPIPIALAPVLAPIDPTKTVESPEPIPKLDIPDRKPAEEVYAEQQRQFNRLHPESPGRFEEEVIFASPTPIHWEPQKEHFPVPPESIIQLPSGKPIAIPKIQYDFPPESAEAKAAREKKRDIIRDEAKRSWAGYKKFAWMHDELMPVSGRSKDPFCGWAATLVDSLDTLWIMGLIPEFEEAVKAVELIDFTTTPRPDIPMFETTIRYLGGLLAAYDLSDGKYRILLDKAVELGEILYSAFDTPNRMPVLYYQWKPVFASQPHRAGTKAGTAELGSMAMEFTRLAQLTKEPKYYDAVARVTNALEEFQNQGTGLAGVFPNDFDASGCNTTRPTPTKPVEEPHGFQPPMPALPEEPSKNGVASEVPGNLEFQIIPEAAGGLSKARIQGWGENHDDNKRDDVTDGDDGATKEMALKRMKRSGQLDPTLSIDTTQPMAHRSGSDRKSAKMAYAGPELDFSPKMTDTTWDCVPQGLVAANSKYHMGGGQDSAYEYLPKQYALLGGLEDKYRTMYLKVIDAVRQHMLYRPMIPGDRNVLFSGKVTQFKDKPSKFDAEATHLTCFIGGMVGMGAKLFGIEGDLEIAKLLTDGCVWAYESMPSGIMPEAGHLLPCQSVHSCPWNETLWRESLDPDGAERREKAREEYFKRKELLLKAEAEEAAEKAAELAEAVKAAAEAKDAAVHQQAIRLASTGNITKEEAAILLQKEAKEKEPLYELEPVVEAPESTTPKNLHKRQIDMMAEIKHNAAPHADVDAAASYEKSKLAQMRADLKSNNNRPKTSTFNPAKSGIETGKIQVQEVGFDKKLEFTEQELEAQNPRGNAYKKDHNIVDMLPQLSGIPNLGVDGQVLIGGGLDPSAPLSHEDFVGGRVRNERLVPGWMSLDSREYILRPEAIESVWYMYRITGDPIWQEKGWKMWLAIIAATTVEYGNSAISDVSVVPDPEEPSLPLEGGFSPLRGGGRAGALHKDSMESFWLAETLKYFFLLFEEPGVVSLDEWVLNTEAHPFRRPT